MTEDNGAYRADDAANRTALGRARAMAAAWVGGVILVTAFSGQLPRVPAVAVLVLPAAVMGAVSPVIGFRLYLLLRERIAPETGPAERRRLYIRAVSLALAVTALAAIFGVIIYGTTGELITLIGPFMHILLAGAIWPTDDRLEAFVDPPAIEKR